MPTRLLWLRCSPPRNWRPGNEARPRPSRPSGDLLEGRLDWAQIAALAPQIADTLGRYLSQAATFLAPNSVEVADRTLRQLAGWLLEHSDIRAVADIGRSDIEDFKVCLSLSRACVARA